MTAAWQNIGILSSHVGDETFGILRREFMDIGFLFLLFSLFASLLFTR